MVKKNYLLRTKIILVLIMNVDQIEIPFAGDKLTLKFPKTVDIEILKPNEKVSETNFDLQQKCKEIFTEITWIHLKGKKVLFVVNDATRATPTEILLDYLVPFFKTLSITYDFIIATGSHRKPSDQELKSIFGKFYDNVKENIYIHDAKDESSLVSLGKNSFDSEIKLNKLLFNKKYSSILTVNSIEPHYFAGWTGGRKSVVPGLAGYETITQNHIHALSPESQNCRLKGNPIHDGLQEGFDLFLTKINNKFYTFQFVLDSQGTIHNLFAGDYSVFQEGVKFASKIFQVPTRYEYEMVIAVAYPPLDQDLYQAHKALENSKQIIRKSNLRNKSVFVLVSGCKNGIGPDQFLVPFKLYANLSFTDTMNEIANNYKLGFHKAGKILEAEQYAELLLFSKLSKEKAAEAHFVSITGDLNEFINQKIKENAITKIALIFDACVTVPVLN